MLDRDGLDGALQADSGPERVLPPPPPMDTDAPGVPDVPAVIEAPDVTEAVPSLRPPSWRWAAASLALTFGVAAAIAFSWHGRDRSPTAPTYLHSPPQAVTPTRTATEMSARDTTPPATARGPAAGEKLVVDLVLPARFAFNDTRPQGDAAAIGAVAARCRGKIVLTGHADRLGSDRINDEVAFGRAAAVRAILAAYGVDGARVRVASAGARLPVASNDSASGRSLNRRVTLTCSMANPGGEP